MRKLTLFEDYSREEAHDIFEAHTKFTPQAGTCGLQGTISLQERLGDFVFFVTFGQSQGEHVFDEGITAEGVLSWQSKPSQTLATPKIETLINHDHTLNNIYLFLHTQREGKYTYLGKLAYLEHDNQRENPVYFQWKLLDWPVPSEVSQKIGLALQPVQSQEEQSLPVGLLETPVPRSHKHGKDTATFRAYKSADRSYHDKKLHELGLQGELLVVKHEKQLLYKAGRQDLAEAIVHVSLVEGDGVGYDVRSFWPDGTLKHIEVKTTCGGDYTPFDLTANELRFSASHPESYCLYRLHSYDVSRASAKYYFLYGDLNSSCQLTPSSYRAQPNLSAASITADSKH